MAAFIPTITNRDDTMCQVLVQMFRNRTLRLSKVCLQLVLSNPLVIGPRHGKVDMRVDHSRHDRTMAQVQYFRSLSVSARYLVGGGPSHRSDESLVYLQQDVLLNRTAASVNEPAGQYQLFFVQRGSTFLD